MKLMKSKWMTYGAVLLAMIAIMVFAPVPTWAKVTLATVPAVVVKKKEDDVEDDFHLEVDAEGKLKMTKEDFQKALQIQSDRTAKTITSQLGLDVIKRNILGAHDAEQDEATKFAPKANETPSAKAKRLHDSIVSIKGGTLALAKAPKEVKTMRYFKALMDKDGATAKELGEGSWTEKTLTEGTAADGGNLVPVEFATDLLVAIEQYGAIQDCTQHQMTTNELDLRSVTTKPIIYQVGETVAPTQAGTKFGKPVLTAKAFAGSQVISRELMQDNNVGLYDKLLALFAEAFAQKKSSELFVGSAFTSVPGSTNIVKTYMGSQTVADLKFKEIVNMISSLTEGQLANGGKHYMHRITWGYIQGIEDLNGRPIVQNPWDAKNRTLLGFPVVLDEMYPYAGGSSKPVITFGNLKWADHGVRQAVTAQVATEGTVASVNLAEQRSIALIIDTRWGINVSMDQNIGGLYTKV
jgi:HK97 family phage major capsid protein